MRIGVPTEVKPQEYRVAMTPAGVQELVRHGHDVVVQAGAGVGSTLPLDVPNLILTPHIGFHTDEADVVFRVAADNIVAFAAGRPQNVLTPWEKSA